jgi:hypothetical protein
LWSLCGVFVESLWSLCVHKHTLTAVTCFEHFVLGAFALLRQPWWKQCWFPQIFANCLHFSPTSMVTSDLCSLCFCSGAARLWDDGTREIARGNDRPLAQ